jgi:hypothetical protein
MTSIAETNNQQVTPVSIAIVITILCCSAETDLFHLAVRAHEPDDVKELPYSLFRG